VRVKTVTAMVQELVLAGAMDREVAFGPESADEDLVRGLQANQAHGQVPPYSCMLVCVRICYVWSFRGGPQVGCGSAARRRTRRTPKFAGNMLFLCIHNGWSALQMPK
jgi:hypothetical protein